MKKISVFSIALISLLFLTSCEAIETIFKAGMWWGIILVIAVIVIILLLFSRGKNS
ncbi:phosphatidate cytidylyltransferase [Chryseobacterium sp.]|uniref:phosphatidate cytidylyltransferase n=1 Tax=Chryseobacterium sp. TaxID=1871047 RepID=UPI0025BB268B|nr:phosphatidate cytidylyltransferase [Chryseobacterium sp.]